MAFPLFHTRLCENPASKECFEIMQGWKELIKYTLTRRVLPPLKFPLPRPDPPPFDSDVFKGDPDPQPNFPDYLEFQNTLNGELLLSALRQPNSTPLIKRINESGVQLKAMEELLDEFEFAASSIREELIELKELQSKR